MKTREQRGATNFKHVKDLVLERTNGVPNDEVLLSIAREFSPGIMKAVLDGKINLSFSGCGFMCIYHAGVCAAIKEYAPELAANRVSGASAGSIAAAGLVCNVCISQATSAILTVVTKARERALGALHPSFNLIGLVRKNLQEILPDDAHVICSGRLEISLTRVGTNENIVVDHFETKAELIDAIVCSCFIPFYCGRTPPEFRGVQYFDGGWSDNQPMADKHTITVSPFSGESDICPSDGDSASLFDSEFSNTSIRHTVRNLFRLTSCLIPARPETCSRICRQGFEDTLRFLSRVGLSPCARCLTIQSTGLPLPHYRHEIEVTKKHHHKAIVQSPVRSRYESECDNCLEKVSTIRADDVRKLFPKIMEKTLNENSPGFKSMPILDYLSQMRIVQWAYNNFAKPIELLFIIARNLNEWLSTVREHDPITERLELLAKSFLQSFDRQKNMYCATMSCQLAITDISLGGNQRHEYVLTKPAPKPVPVKKLTTSMSDQALKELKILKKHDQQKKRCGRSRDNSSCIELQLSPSTSNVCDDPDSLDHVVDYTEKHEALLAYYYHDDNNQLQVCHIYALGGSSHSSHSCHSSNPKNSLLVANELTTTKEETKFDLEFEEDECEIPMGGGSVEHTMTYGDDREIATDSGLSMIEDNAKMGCGRMKSNMFREVDFEQGSWIDLFVDCMLKNCPVILCPEFTKNWQSRSEWVSDDGKPFLESLVRQFGNLMIPVIDGDDQCNYGEMTLSDFAKYFTEGGRERLIYAKDWHFQRDADCSPYKLPLFLQSDWFNHEERSFVGDYRFVYIGVRETWTRFHCDVMNSYSWSANVCGRKLWYFVPAGGEEHFRTGKETYAADIREYRDRWQKAGVIEVIQEEGEIVFVPSSWFHQVHNLEDTISINHNFINSSNVDMALSAIQKRIQEIVAEIEDSRNMFTDEEFVTQVQLILKADSKVDVATFIDFLDYLISDRSLRATFCWICPRHVNVFDFLRGCTTRGFSQSKPFDWDAARAHFSRFPGGAVTLKSDDARGLATIELNHPGKKNALSGKMMVDLDDCVRKLESWNGSVIVVTGANGDFCTGGDLEFVKKTATPEDGFTMCTFMGNILIRLRRLPAITVAKGDGYILGGGSELFSSCDIRAMNLSAKVGFVQGRLGVTPGWGGTARMVEILGRSKAIELLATASVLDATAAKNVALATFVYKTEEEFTQYVSSLLRNKPDVVKVSKHIVDGILSGSSLEECLKIEREDFIKFWGGKAHLEALTSKPKHK
ncbi:hypothetical protein QR680_002107 [Steinernema hermaphroditum]|uniref:triacylglycerol lipase n=1 Tax=Steinernema hermaphroditum TaxID=289476 RepID=A0AA39LHF0_9BILA|nr:hypothetical protein QR680_002107 [Steinernema hermaphroditum]